MSLKEGRWGCLEIGFAMRAMAVLPRVNISRKAAKPAKVYAKIVVLTPRGKGSRKEGIKRKNEEW